MMTDRRVAVTGIGLVCALGSSRDMVWEHMLGGHCGVRPVTLFDTEGFRSRVGAQVELFDLLPRLTPFERRRLSRSEQFGVLSLIHI